MFQKYLLESLLNTHEGIRYIKSSFENEQHEFNRVSDHFNVPIDHIKNQYEKSVASVLTPDIAKKLENTDSNAPGLTVKKSKHILNSYGRSAARQQHTVNAFNNKKVESPIILHHVATNTYHLVAGNTRLIHAKLHGITPMVHIVHV